MSARSATTGPGSAPLSRPTTPVWATPVRTSSKTQRAQVLGHDAGGAELAVAQFGVLVEVAPPGDDGGFDGRSGLVDGGGERTQLPGCSGTSCFLRLARAGWHCEPAHYRAAAGMTRPQRHFGSTQISLVIAAQRMLSLRRKPPT